MHLSVNELPRLFPQAFNGEKREQFGNRTGYWAIGSYLHLVNSIC